MGALRLFADVAGGGQVELVEQLGVQLALMGFVEALKFGFHVLHVSLLRDHAIFVGFHKQEELSDVFLAKGEAILRFGNGGFLGGGGPKKRDSAEQDGDGNDKPGPVRRIWHG
jgi:hypothetical protein